MNRSLLQLPLSAGSHSTAEHSTLLRMTNAERRLTVHTLESSRDLCYDRRSVGQSVLGYSTHLRLTTRFYYCQTVAGLLTWGALSDERTGLSFTIAAGLRQRSHFRVRVPWDSRPYFTASDSRLPFSSPSTTRRVKVEVFDATSTRETLSNEFESYVTCSVDPRMTALARVSSNCNRYTRPLVRESAPHQQTLNSQRLIKIWS
jgi:hypothetical protein